MKTEQIVMCIVALALGMLVANMLTNVCGCKTGVEGFTFRGDLPAGLSPGARTALIGGSCGSEDDPAPITDGCAGGSIANLKNSADLCNNTYPTFSNMGSYLDQLSRYPYRSYCPEPPPLAASCSQCVHSSQGGGPGLCVNSVDSGFDCSACPNCPSADQIDGECPTGKPLTALSANGLCPPPN